MPQTYDKSRGEGWTWNPWRTPKWPRRRA